MSPRGALLLPGHPRSVTLREEALTLTPAGTALLPYWKAENITDTSGERSLFFGFDFKHAGFIFSYQEKC